MRGLSRPERHSRNISRLAPRGPKTADTKTLVSNTMITER